MNMGFDFGSCFFIGFYFLDTKGISEFQLWGNYSIPKDNPFSQDKNLLPEIWAMGVRNPWRCSFDAERPSYFLCADVGEVYQHILCSLFRFLIYDSLVKKQ